MVSVLSKWECLFFYLSCLREFRGHVSLIILLCPVSLDSVTIFVSNHFTLLQNHTIPIYSLSLLDLVLWARSVHTTKLVKTYFFFLSLPGDFSLQSLGIWIFEGEAEGLVFIRQIWNLWNLDPSLIRFRPTGTTSGKSWNPTLN